jgi:intracellular septation protein A
LIAMSAVRITMAKPKKSSSIKKSAMTYQLIMIHRNLKIKTQNNTYTELKITVICSKYHILVKLSRIKRKK